MPAGWEGSTWRGVRGGGGGGGGGPRGEAMESFGGTGRGGPIEATP